MVQLTDLQRAVKFHYGHRTPSVFEMSQSRGAGIRDGGWKELKLHLSTARRSKLDHGSQIRFRQTSDGFETRAGATKSGVCSTLKEAVDALIFKLPVRGCRVRSQAIRVAIIIDEVAMAMRSTS